MTILEKVETAMKDTMHSFIKTKAVSDSRRLTALKLIKTELVKVNDNNNNYRLTEDEEVGVMLSMIKKHEKSIEIYKGTNRNDLLEIEENELAIINEFTPKQPTVEEMETYQREIVKNYKAEKGDSYYLSMMDCKPILALMTKKFPHINGKFVSDIMRKIVNGK